MVNWRSPRFFILLIVVCVALVTSIGIGTYLINHSQSSPNTQWVRLPPSTPGQPTPTAPPGGYLFKDAAGGFVVYHVPITPPSPITWMTYRNQQDGYTIDYPSNWVEVKSPSNGHDGFVFYPPGTDPHENVPSGPKGIGLGWTDTHMPVPTDPTVADSKSITIDGVHGQLYTQAGLGATITVIFPYKGGSFTLIADANSDTLIYVFQHMLDSLRFR